MFAVKLAEADQKFYDDTARMVELDLVHHDTDESDIYWQRLLDTLEQREVSRTAVIATFYDLISKHPDRQMYFAMRMSDIYWFCKHFGLYDFPEFFWMLVSAGVLADLENISEVMRVMKEFGNYDVLRTHLISALLTEEDPKLRKELIHAFYHTGHTLESLKLVDTVLQAMPDADQWLLGSVYIDAAAYTFRRAEKNALTAEDVVFLKPYLSRIVNPDDPNEARYRQSALEILEKTDFSQPEG